MLFILLCLSSWLFATSMVVEKPVYDLEKAEKLFEEFIITHNKSYSHNEEKQKRFKIFRENVKHIVHMNSMSKAVRAITRFTDLTTEEFVSKYTGMRRNEKPNQPNTCKVITDDDITTSDAPTSFDWRQKNVVTPVKNQHSCGTCWAFSCTGSIEGQYAIKHSELRSFSEQQLIDCLQSSGRCSKGGDMVDVMSELKTVAGVELESDYPYFTQNKENQVCKFEKSKVKVHVSDCYRFDLKDENKFKEALYKYGPISIGLDSSSWSVYHGGVYDVSDCPLHNINHGVLLVGYGTEDGKDYWIIKNSWGTNFGEQGYIRITRGENACGLMNDSANTVLVA